MLAGPLVLLPYRKFDDCLDGVVFGAALRLDAPRAPRRSRTPRASCTSASAPPATSRLWIARLLTLGVTMPVLGAGVAGATCGAFWLRLRSPVPDGRALGIFGSPFARGADRRRRARRRLDRRALPRPLGRRSRSRRCSPAAALVWLRWTIQLGLRQEAEREADRAADRVPELPSRDAARIPSAATAASACVRSRSSGLPTAPRRPAGLGCGAG